MCTGQPNANAAVVAPTARRIRRSGGSVRQPHAPGARALRLPPERRPTGLARRYHSIPMPDVPLLTLTHPVRPCRPRREPPPNQRDPCRGPGPQLARVEREALAGIARVRRYRSLTSRERPRSHGTSGQVRRADQRQRQATESARATASSSFTSASFNIGPPRWHHPQT